VVRNLTLTGTQRSSVVLQAELTSPMQIAWGGAANAIGDSTLKLTGGGVESGGLEAVPGPRSAGGTVNGQVKVLSQQGGEQLTFDLSSQIEELTVAVAATPSPRQASACR